MENILFFSSLAANEDQQLKESEAAFNLTGRHNHQYHQYHRYHCYNHQYHRCHCYHHRCHPNHRHQHDHHL